MAALLLDCAVRSTLIAAGTAGVLAALRIKSAPARHAAWAAVVIAMLCLPIWSAAGARVPLRVLQPAASTAVAPLEPIGKAAGVVGASAAPVATSVGTAEPDGLISWSRAAATVYFLGVNILLARLTVGTVSAIRLRRSAVCVDGQATSSGCVTPITIGWLAPVPILPVGWLDWSKVQLAAVLTHEGAHARRRDPLVQWVAILNRAIFWFHPLAWWLERRLAVLAEEACDAVVLKAGHAPEDYSECLLNFARVVTEQGQRLRAIGTAMPGGGLAARLHRIIDDVPAPPLSIARATCTVVFCAMFSGVFAAATLVPRSPAAASGQAGPNAQTFEVASIKPCASEPTVPGGRSGGSGSFSPGRVYLSCFVTKNLVDVAYIQNRGSRTNTAKDPADPIYNWPGLLGRDLTGGPQQIRGGPSWFYSDKYTVEATAPGLDPAAARNPDRATMLGPMLRALLEERFKLKVHEEVEEAPMWALTVAKGGLKIKPAAAGSCTDDRSNGPITLSKAASLGVKPTCGTVSGGPDRPNWRYEHAGQPLGVIATMLSTDLGVKVIDRTGIKDLFNITWEYGPDENTPGTLRMLAALGVNPPDAATARTAASVFTALEQQLGLKVEKIKGSRGYLVIDQIERPTPDGPAVLLPPPARAGGVGRIGAGPRSRR